MEDICKYCWNISCRNKGEDFMKSKVDICKDMEENPEKWDFYNYPYYERDYWEE